MGVAQNFYFVVLPLGLGACAIHMYIHPRTVFANFLGKYEAKLESPGGWGSGLKKTPQCETYFSSTKHCLYLTNGKQVMIC